MATGSSPMNPLKLVNTNTSIRKNTYCRLFLILASFNTFMLKTAHLFVWATHSMKLKWHFTYLILTYKLQRICWIGTRSKKFWFASVLTTEKTGIFRLQRKPIKLFFDPSANFQAESKIPDFLVTLDSDLLLGVDLIKQADLMVQFYSTNRPIFLLGIRHSDVWTFYICY